MIRANKQISYLVAILLATVSLNCTKHSTNPPPTQPVPFHYKTENVVIVVIDGPRYTETWGDAAHTYIPKRYALLQQGVFCSSFYNNGKTSTVPGHTAISTGIYETIDNDGTQYPQKPSIFQNWLKASNASSSKAWIITTKDKLEVLSDCTEPGWKGTYKPMTDCGVNGLGTGYRFDNETFLKVKETFTRDHPKLMLINFKQPDEAGHQGDSIRYLKGITDTDNYVDLIWQAIQNDSIYKNKTTMIVTNDHGRHTAGHLDGFISHGDDCDGCRHIEMFAIGPDFKKNFISNVTYDQIDITATVAELLYFDMPFAKGKIIEDIFTQLK